MTHDNTVTKMITENNLIQYKTQYGEEIDNNPRDFDTYPPILLE